MCLLDDPTVEGYIVSGLDIASRKKAEGELFRALSLLQATLDATADGILVVDREGHISTYNRRFAEMWSVPHELLEDGDANTLLDHVTDQLEDPEGFLAKVAELRSHPELNSFDHLPFKDGRSFERFSMPQRVDGVVTGRVWSFSDVTQRKDLEEKLAHQAFHDSLTGLANQALFRERVEHLLARPGGPPALAVAFLDLDNFKTINDSLGHTAGNELLVEVSRRIQSCLRSTDTAARLGGDEFAVLLEGTAVADVSVVSERLLEAMAPSMRIAGKDVSVTCSIGIALGGPDVGCDQLLRNADLAMYTAKQRGKGRYEWFEAGMHASALERLEVEVALREALVRDELAVFYQPIYALGTGAVVGIEALVRWNHPEWGLVEPAAFVPVAEETGCIVEIGELVLAQACAQTRAWQDALGMPELQVSVNLSPRQLREPDLPELVRSILASAGLAPANLILEITEGAMMVDPDASLATLEALKSLGLQLAIDDFGTGYSSLSYLQRFPIDVLKIDGTFAAGATGQQEESALIAAIVHLADSLGLTAVAEGIETAEQARALAAMGCDWAQGHHFARAQPAAPTFEALRRAVGPDLAPLRGAPAPR